MKEERVVSRHNARIRAYRRLDESKARSVAGSLAAEGVRLVFEALRSPLEVRRLYLGDGLGAQARRDLLAAAGERRVEIVSLPDDLFAWMAHTVNPQGAAAEVALPAIHDLSALPPTWQRLVVLHRPQDPGNVGAVMRSCEAAGCSALVLAGASADPFAPKAVRASMGSVFRLPIARGPSMGEVVESLADAGYRLLAALPDAARSIYETDLSGRVALLFGGETGGLGLAADLVEAFRLPMSGEVESLNLAQAVTAVVYEILRRDLETWPA